MSALTGSEVEQASPAWLESVGYLLLSGAQIASGEAMPERIVRRCA